MLMSRITTFEISIAMFTYFYGQWRLFVEGIFLAVSIFSLSHIDKKVKYHSRVPSLILSRVTLKNGQACFENLGALTAQDF